MRQWRSNKAKQMFKGRRRDVDLSLTWGNRQSEGDEIPNREERKKRTQYPVREHRGDWGECLESGDIMVCHLIIPTKRSVQLSMKFHETKSHYISGLYHKRLVKEGQLHFDWTSDFSINVTKGKTKAAENVQFWIFWGADIILGRGEKKIW